ncbi:PGPGW domain-containing protein [Pseudonocardia broussonetiae]|uniref:Transmembrane protein (PGPGW) n=1 Tax=Pseudonocardia broussonetiae TaxID=2736640 RepID=A0A6M6JC78_9PSEU|nr:PGPGW domain-containing protein [Pseudonocardia broussonetiae]QJY44680.1 hypothetical protein HOP40_01550 [Pseudonocardia broussonetiae]
MSEHPNAAARVLYLVVGGLLLLAGIALLVLPGPGLLLVLGGLLVLAHGFPAAQRYVGPVRRRAMDAADQSVASPLRIAFSVLTGLALVVAGVVWGLVPGLPLGGWPTGSSLVLSGLVLLGLLVFSYRRVHGRTRAPAGGTRTGGSSRGAPGRTPHR